MTPVERLVAAGIRPDCAAESVMWYQAHDGHHRTAVDRDVLIDGQNIDACTGEHVQHAGEHAGLIPQYGLERDDPAVEHILKGMHRVLILIERAPADAHLPGRAVHRGLLPGL